MRFLFFISFFIITTISFAQDGPAFGLKGGLNYGGNGTFTSELLTEDAEKFIGFHVGVFGKLDTGPIFLRPELVYTRTESEYSYGDLVITKLDVPLLVGIDIVRSFSVFAGPDFQYILSNKFDDFVTENPENQFTIGAQFGVAINFLEFGIDLRYERGLSENEALVEILSPSRVDTRPEQIILSLSVSL